jgi:Fe-S cluster assembly iron-binding protein IscA
LGLALDEPTEKDNMLELNGITVLAEKSLNSFLEEQVIDFVTSGGREGFVVGPSWGHAC